jgi:hypothetical protein
VPSNRPAPRHRVLLAGRPVLVAVLAAVLGAACSSDASVDSIVSGATSTPAPIPTVPPGNVTTTTARPPTTTPPSTTPPSTTPPSTTRPPSASAGLTAIDVPSTTSQYFVLYVKPDLAAATEVPVAIVKGEPGSTTITDRRSALPAAHYRVASFSVAAPGDVDGDGVDDLTELADPVGANPLNPAPKLDARNGAVIVSTPDAFARLSYQGDDVARDQYLAGLEFMKFWIVGTNTAQPAVYFMNTNTFKAHPEFASAVGLPGGRGPSAGSMRGDVVYDPDAIAPDGSKGAYRFAFQPSDAYSFREIALAYELLVANMPVLQNNLRYYAFPQSAYPLYQREKARYDAYRVPVMAP